MAFFSIIVPVYNREKLLERSIGSLINQTFKDIEIICVDDGSTDNSLQKLLDYQKIDNRIKVIHQKNGGVSRARNTGLANATGKYIMFLDSDDEYMPNTCEKCFERINRDNADIISFEFLKIINDFCYNVFFEGKNYYIEKKDKSFIRFHNRNFGETFYTNGKNFPLTGSIVWNLCIRKSVLDSINLKFISRIKYSEDFIFTSTLFLHHGLKFSFIFEPLIKYYDTKNGLHKKFVIEMINDIICLKWLRYYNKKYKLNSDITLKHIFYVHKRYIIGTGFNQNKKLKNYIISKVKKEKFFDLNSLSSNACYISPKLSYSLDYGFKIVENSTYFISTNNDVCNFKYFKFLDLVGLKNSSKIKLKAHGDFSFYLLCYKYEKKASCYEKIIVNGKNIVEKPFYASDDLRYFFNFTVRNGDIIDIEFQFKKFDLIAYIKMKILSFKLYFSKKMKLD